MAQGTRRKDEDYKMIGSKHCMSASDILYFVWVLYDILVFEDVACIAFFFIFLLRINLKFCLMPGSNLLQICLMLCMLSLKISFSTVGQSSNWRLSYSQHNIPNWILGRILFCIFRISSTGLKHGSKLRTVWGANMALGSSPASLAARKTGWSISWKTIL